MSYPNKYSSVSNNDNDKELDLSISLFLSNLCFQDFPSRKPCSLFQEDSSNGGNPTLSHIHTLWNAQTFIRKLFKTGRQFRNKVTPLQAKLEVWLKPQNIYNIFNGGWCLAKWVDIEQIVLFSSLKPLQLLSQIGLTKLLLILPNLLFLLTLYVLQLSYCQLKLTYYYIFVTLHHNQLIYWSWVTHLIFVLPQGGDKSPSNTSKPTQHQIVTHHHNKEPNIMSPIQFNSNPTASNPITNSLTYQNHHTPQTQPSDITLV